MGTYDLVAIDPGKNELAYAAFAGDRLQAFGELPAGCAPVDPDGSILTAPEVVWETPQADGRGVPPDDLISLSSAGAELARWIAGYAGRTRAYRPRDWKGSVAKPVHHSRLWDALTTREKALLGGSDTRAAIRNACARGAADAWRKSGKMYYLAREFPLVAGVKISHDILDASALGCKHLGRIK